MQKVKSMLRWAFQRYFIDAMGAMAAGLFSSLIIGTIIGQFAKAPALAFLAPLSEALGAKSPVVGAAIGVAIAWGMKVDPRVLFACAGAGAVGYNAGGPVGAYIAAVIGAEFGRLVSKKTPVDILVTPIVAIITGGLAGHFTGGYVQSFMTAIGSVINTATEMSRVPMGIIVSAVVGMVLTLPISSAALCIMLDLSGLAAGAATVGCSAQMIGFAVASRRDNDFGGFLSQAIGTSMLQVPNIFRRPQIWIAPTLAAAVLGPVSTRLMGMTNNAMGAGMGTCALVGQITTFGVMSDERGALVVLAQMLFLHILAPAALTLVFDWLLRKIGWVRDGDMALRD